MTRVIAGCKHRVIKVVASFGEPAKASRFTETMRVCSMGVVDNYVPVLRRVSPRKCIGS